MYLKHYNLTLKPFEISTDLKFLWLGEKHNEALAALKYGILDNKGFVSLTGGAGTGKSILISELANSLDDNFIFAQIDDPSLELLDFINLTADAFKMNKKFSTKGDFLSHFKNFLNNAYVHHKEVVLVIEEAQRFDQERLEEVRLLSNIEKPDKKLINIVFVGQNEFNHILIKNKALRQRVTIFHNIEPLQEIETEQYVTHRLKVAGSERKIFSSEAIHEIYTFSEGNPRLINIICDSALLTGYAKEKIIIEPEIIRECAANYLLPKPQKEDVIEDLEALSESIPETGTGIQPGTSGNSYQKDANKVRIKPARHKLAYATPVFVVILLSIFGYLYFFGENHASYRDLKTFLGQAFDRYTGSKSETSSQKPDEITITQTNISGTQAQALDLKTQNTSTENQLAQLKPHNEELKAALEELKGAKERIVELEREVPMLNTMLSQSQQKVAKLAKELKQGKHSGEVLSPELSSKVDLIAELREKLEDSQSNALEAETKIENSTKKINELQEQLENSNTEKASTEAQLGQLRSQNEALTANLAKLKGAEERVAALEGELATRDQALSQSEQKVTGLTNALDRGKKDQELLQAELSTKTELVAELEQKLGATLSSGAELANDIEKSKNENAELQGRLLDLKAQKTASDTLLGQLKSRNKKLTTDLEELRGAKERVATLEGGLAMGEQKLTDLAKELDQEKQNREQLSSELSIKADLVAELEGELATRDQALSQSEQKVTGLTNALDQGKKDQELLRAELSTKTELVAELEQKLGVTLSSGAELANDIEKSKNENAELQGRLLDLKAQKTASDTLLGQLKSRNKKLTADLEELRGAKERVATLEGAVAMGEQKLTDLAKELDQEKQSGELLGSELSTKVNLIAELQEKLANAQSNVMEVEAKIENGTIKINELQEQTVGV